MLHAPMGQIDNCHDGTNRWRMFAPVADVTMNLLSTSPLPGYRPKGDTTILGWLSNRLATNGRNQPDPTLCRILCQYLMAQGRISLVECNPPTQLDEYAEEHDWLGWDFFPEGRIYKAYWKAAGGTTRTTLNITSYYIGARGWLWGFFKSRTNNGSSGTSTFTKKPKALLMHSTTKSSVR